MITNASAADAIRKLTAWMRKYSRSPPKMKIRVKTAMTVTAMTNFPVSRANQFPASAIRVLLFVRTEHAQKRRDAIHAEEDA